jgi:hypothetical protein
MLSDTKNHFQRLSLGESLRHMVTVYCSGFVVFTQIGLLNLATQVVLSAFLLWVLRPAFGLDNDNDDNDDANNFQDPQYLQAHLGGFYAYTFCSTALNIVMTAVFLGAMTRVVADIYLQRNASVKDCLQLGARHTCTMMGASLLAYIACMLGMLLLIIPGIYLSVMLFVIKPAVIIEGLGVFGSLKRSYNLVSGKWCYVFCIFFILFIITFALQMIWTTIFVGGNDALSTLWGSFVASIPGVIIIPMWACITTITYINLRVEKESLDAKTLAQNLGESSGDMVLYSALISDQQEGENPLV